MTNSLLFLAALGLLLGLVMTWAFRFLPREKWQVLACVPLEKHAEGRWTGLNLTYYGLLSASAYLLAAVLFLILLGSVHVSLIAALVVLACILVCCVPASRLIAQMVEGAQSGFTIGGASFVGLLLSPALVGGFNASIGTSTGNEVPLLPTLAAAAIAYSFGEGMGRLACISFGCCYGKPVRELGPRGRRLFSAFHFVFEGGHKKIAYASGLEGVPVVPIQALTALFLCSLGLVASWLFLTDHFGLAYALTVILSQGWRVYSETLRADYRGGGSISAYQYMAFLGIAYAVGIVLAVPSAAMPKADILAGLTALSTPALWGLLGFLWLGLFLYTGCSQTTGAVLSFHVNQEKATPSEPVLSRLRSKEPASAGTKSL